MSLKNKIISLQNDKPGTKSPKPEAQPSPLPDPEIREDFLKCKYAFQYVMFSVCIGLFSVQIIHKSYSLCITDKRSLTFDPDTTHHFLRVREDNRKLTNTSPWQHSYPAHPARFEYWRQAMTSDSLYQGRHYIEAELSGEGAHVGVTYKSIDRKGEQSTSCITGNDFSWCMGRNSRGFFSWHAGVETLLEVGDAQRVGLYVDFHQGCVCFYDVTGDMRLLHKYFADFMEPLYVTAWLSKKDNTVCLVDSK